MVRLITLVILVLAAGPAAAQINHSHSEVGIYSVENPQGVLETEVEAPANVMFECYVVLTNPYNEALGRPVTTVGGFEFRPVFPDGVYLLRAICPPPGDCGWLTGHDFLVGCEAPVSAGARTLVTMTVMSTTGAADVLYLTPVHDAPQSIPGEMAFTDFDDGFSLQVMHPVSGSHDVPVFALNWDGELPFGETVPARAASFGGVKALYR